MGFAFYSGKMVLWTMDGQEVRTLFARVSEQFGGGENMALS